VPISDLANRLNGWPRRILAVCCLLLAGVAALGAGHSGDTRRAGHPVLVAARDLAAGTRLSASDVRLRTWPDELRPAGAFSSRAAVSGRSLGGAVRAGEAVTETRLSGPGLAAGLPPTLRAVPVQVTGGTAGLLHSGEFVDLLVSDPPEAEGVAPPAAHLLAEAVPVLAVTSTPAGADSFAIVVAVDASTALKLAAVSGRTLVATLRHPP
jgi:Flp pilus assembly protein CpaB